MLKGEVSDNKDYNFDVWINSKDKEKWLKYRKKMKKLLKKIREAMY